MASLEETQEVSENRENLERREFTWRTVFFGFLRSRRRNFRRSRETDTQFIDWHHPWHFFLATGTMLLCCLDAFFTLRLLDRGAIEVNPIMAAALEQSAFVFAASKLLLTGIGLLMLVFLSRTRLFNFLRTGLLLTVFFSFYACLVCYQFLLLIRPL